MALRKRRPAKAPQSEEKLQIVEKSDAAVAGAFRQYRALRIVAVIALAGLVGYILLALFEPTPEYRITEDGAALDSPEFLRAIEAVADSRLAPGNLIQAIPNGDRFYEAELAAIRAASDSISLEAYIFSKGEIAQKFIDALAQRARAGVKVRMVLDGAGSARTPKRYFRPVMDAGGKIEWYHPLRLTTWHRYNNRTHRELLVVDGKVAFVGGAGVADWWYKEHDGKPRWRDNMFRVEGPAVASVMGTFLENWVEASGELVSSPEYFPQQSKPGQTLALVVNSTPSAGRSTRARMLYQSLLAHARKTIHITTPYFVPDQSAVEELVRARRRGVEVKVLVPGEHTDHELVRYSSRGLWGDLLKAGAQMYEYKPAMLHAKVMVIDGAWTVVGSANIDNRSFGLNDEVNLAAFDPAFAATMSQIFHDDVSQSDRITLEEWQRRGPWERLQGWLGWLIARQQ